jgi:hypothetical protein
MPLQNQHSRTSGAIPNLAPGQVAVNLKDEVLWLRAGGTKVSVDLARWRLRGVPGVGAIGAPLRQEADGLFFDTQLAPSCLVDGVVAVDRPGWGVPGLQVLGAATNVVLGASGVLMEPFYVASDAITVQALSFKTASAPAGIIRVGICTEAGAIVASAEVTTPGAGTNTVALSATLPRGAYYAVLWSQAAASFSQITGYRIEQGWTESDTGVPSFALRLTTAPIDMTSAFEVPTVNGTEDGDEPGALHSLLIQWT